jgi:hypothetical protein
MGRAWLRGVPLTMYLKICPRSISLYIVKQWVIMVS